VPSELHTTALRLLVQRFQEGDARALNELLQRAAGRLERLAGAMLHRYPRVRQREQTADVVQEAMLSLVGALRQLTFCSTREFFGLAAEHIRRRLLDLNRRYSQPHRTHAPLAEDAGQDERLVAPGADEDELDRWAALHEAVAGLPVELREVFSLRLYHGWSIQEIADLLQVSTRTVTRLWYRAQVRLTEQLAEQPLPGEESGS
jgi:RNA polymerase sigma-70 factor (ECF subfamily)